MLFGLLDRWLSGGEVQGAPAIPTTQITGRPDLEPFIGAQGVWSLDEMASDFSGGHESEMQLYGSEESFSSSSFGTDF